MQPPNIVATLWAPGLYNIPYKVVGFIDRVTRGLSLGNPKRFILMLDTKEKPLIATLNHTFFFLVQSFSQQIISGLKTEASSTVDPI